jgi:single-strand DNA-binding protein
LRAARFGRFKIQSAGRGAALTLALRQGSGERPAFPGDDGTHREREWSRRQNRRRTMFDTARFHIIGRVGKVKEFDNVVRVSIAANASYKEKGEWVDRVNWNEVTIFDKGTREYVAKNVSKGQYVRVEGTLRQNSYERDGDTVYTTELIVDSFSRQPVGKKAEGETEA